MKKTTKLTLTVFGIALSVFLIPTTVVFIVHGTNFFSHWRLGEWLQYSGVLTSAAVSLWLGLRAYNQNEYSRRANLQRPCFGIKKVTKIDGEKESQVEFSVSKERCKRAKRCTSFWKISVKALPTTWKFPSMEQPTTTLCLTRMTTKILSFTLHPIQKCTWI